MKTIKGVFTNNIIEDQDILDSRRKYTFNVTDDNVKVGDMIQSPHYRQLIQVTEISEDPIVDHVSAETGEDSYKVKTIKIVDKLDDTITGVILK